MIKTVMDPVLIGEILQDLRHQKEESMVKAAKSLGISQSALAMYESGKRIPRDEIKIRIARYYGQTVEAIFYSQKQHESCGYGLKDVVKVPRLKVHRNPLDQFT